MGLIMKELTNQCLHHIAGGVFGTPGKLIGGGYGFILDNLDFEGRSRLMLEQAAKDYRNGGFI